MRDRPSAILIFAAGLGTRMGTLTRDLPKPLIRVAGRPLLDHALALADAAGATKKVVNTHYLAPMIARHLASRPDVTISDEQPDVLETGGGLRRALPQLGTEPVFTLNPDAVWTGTNPLCALAEAWDPGRMEGLLMLVPLNAARGHAGTGDFIRDDGGRLSRGPGAIYGGAQIIKTGLLQDIREEAFSLNLLWSRMVERGTLFGIEHDGGWCDVGRPEGIELAEAMLEGRLHV